MEIIRSIDTIRNKTKITFESGWQVWLPSRLVLPFPLSEGTEVDRTPFEKTILLIQYPSALDQAVAMLARRPHSKGEIERKLENAHYDDEVIGLVLYKLEKEKLLDDLDFARKKLKTFRVSDDRQKVFRNTVAALVRRGFSWETARKAFEIASDSLIEDI